MGTYNLSANEIIEEFEDFLMGQEGDVSAEAIAKAWNKLAKKYRWSDRLTIK